MRPGRLRALSRLRGFRPRDCSVRLGRGSDRLAVECCAPVLAGAGACARRLSDTVPSVAPCSEAFFFTQGEETECCRFCFGAISGRVWSLPVALFTGASLTQGEETECCRFFSGIGVAESVETELTDLTFSSLSTSLWRAFQAPAKLRQLGRGLRGCFRLVRSACGDRAHGHGFRITADTVVVGLARRSRPRQRQSQLS